MSVLVVRVDLDPPSKSNSYDVIQRPIVINKKTGETTLKAGLKKSAKAKQFEADLALLVKNRIQQTGFAELEGDVLLQIDWYRTDRRRRDNDNVVKSIQDALTVAGVWKDDSQVASLIVNRFWGQDETEPHLAITVGPRHARAAGIFASLWEKTVGFLHPVVHSKKSWVEQHEAERSLGQEQIPVLRTHCRSCGIGIGIHAHESEVWLMPTKASGGRVTFEIVCGWCADEEELPIEYRVCTEEDLAATSWPKLAVRINARRKELARAHTIAHRESELPGQSRRSA